MAFGDKAVPESRNPFVDMWLNPPNYESAKKAFTSVGRLKAEIQLLEGDIKDTERKARGGSRKATDIDSAKELTVEEREKLNQLKSELHKWEWEVKWLQYHADMAKTVGFSVK